MNDDDPTVPDDATPPVPTPPVPTPPASGETAGPARHAATPDPYDGPDWEGARPFGSSRRRRTSASSGTDPASSGTGSSGIRVKVSRRKKRTLRRRRRLGLVMIGVGGLIVLFGVYLLVTGLLAQHQLNTVRADVDTLRHEINTGELPAARATAAAIASHAHTADLLTSGPGWALAASIPAGGQPFATIRGVTSALDELGSRALPRLVTVSEQIDPSSLRRSDGGINLAPLVAARPELASADAETRAATASVEGLAHHTWLSPVDNARSEILGELSSLGHTVRSADLAAQVAPVLLGQTRPHTYMLMFQSEAELRGTGGLPGAFAIITADNGKLSFDRFESDSTLVGTKTGLELGQEFDQLYAGANAPNDYGDSNVSPNFPYAARIWTAMWKVHSGQTLDGAMAVDPTAISYLLRVTGPATAPGGVRITSHNVVALTQQRIYARFGLKDQRDRRRYQLQLAQAVSRHLLARTGNTTALIRAAGRAASEHRLLLWSADPTIENELAQTTLGGVVPETSQPYVGLAINNAAANKLDAYLDGSLTWRSTGCGITRDVTVTITLTDSAPVNLPTYVYGRTGVRGYPLRKGDDRLLVGYYATSGAQLRSITLNGKPSTTQSGTERGHPVFTVDLQLPRGQPQTLVLHLIEPTGNDSPIVHLQPTVHPLTLSVAAGGCG